MPFQGIKEEDAENDTNPPENINHNFYPEEEEKNFHN
jgi:hypothetical protein